jgi:hypothetical protein
MGSTMNYRYDISPDRHPSTQWLVIDTRNNNMPLSKHDTRETALAEAKKLDKRGAR